MNDSPSDSESLLLPYWVSFGSMILLSPTADDCWRM
jgi:hypothetical protein